MTKKTSDFHNKINMIYLMKLRNGEVEYNSQTIKECLMKIFNQIMFAGNEKDTKNLKNIFVYWADYLIDNHVDSFDIGIKQTLQVIFDNLDIQQLSSKIGDMQGSNSVSSFNIELRKLLDNNKVLSDSQIKAMYAIMTNKNLVFSAPTSYGKTSIIISTIIKRISNIEDSATVCILPTKALLNDYRLEINKLILKSAIKISENPFDIYESGNWIYLFTQERFIIFDSLNTNIKYDYIVIDEAQSLLNVLGKDKERSVILAKCISIIDHKNVPQIYLMPFIKDPYRKCIEKFTNLNINETIIIEGVQSPTSSNKYIISVNENGFKKIELGLDGNRPEKDSFKLFTQKCNNLDDVKYNLFNICQQIQIEGDKTLVYCSKQNISEVAMLYAENRTIQKSFTDRENALINYLNKYIHPEFELISLCKKGIGIHTGDLDSFTKRQLEKIFLEKESSLNILFCTSTLAQGVNLNAKNLLFLPPRGKFDNHKLDIKNLFGRVGRLGANLQGNVYKFYFDNGKNKLETQANLLINAGDEYEIEKSTFEFTDKHEYNDVLKAYIADDTVNNALLEKAIRKKEKVNNLDYFLGIDKSKIVDIEISKYSDLQTREIIRKLKMSSYDDCCFILNLLKDLYWNESNEFVEKYRMASVDHLAIILYGMVIGNSIFSSIDYMIKKHNEKNSTKELWIFQTTMNREYVKFIDADKYFNSEFNEKLRDPKRKYNDKDINLLIYSYIYETQYIIDFKIKKYLQDFYYRLIKNKGESVKEIENFLSYNVTDERRISLAKLGIIDAFAIDALLKCNQIFIGDDVSKSKLVNYSETLNNDDPLRFAIRDVIV